MRERERERERDAETCCPLFDVLVASVCALGVNVIKNYFCKGVTILLRWPLRRRSRRLKKYVAM